MVELDQRELAIAAAFTWLADGVPAKTPAGPLLAAFRKAIEAYEAAKWRPIEEAPRDGTEILIHWPKGGQTALSGSWLTRWSHDGCWGQGDGGLMPNSPLLKGAMFRTIDPPTQDAVQGAQEGVASAEE